MKCEIRKLYLDDDTYPANFPCLVFAWILKDNVKNFTQHPTFRDERGDKYCKELEKDPNFIGWCRNPWTGKLLLTEEETKMFQQFLTNYVI